ncbi:MAG: hypothetical protein J5996_02565 [Prevotella sp.]|nr:hypothetical protein [Prevotella sp.]
MVILLGKLSHGERLAALPPFPDDKWLVTCLFLSYFQCVSCLSFKPVSTFSSDFCADSATFSNDFLQRLPLFQATSACKTSISDKKNTVAGTIKEEAFIGRVRRLSPCKTAFCQFFHHVLPIIKPLLDAGLLTLHLHRRRTPYSERKHTEHNCHNKPTKKHKDEKEKHYL